MQKIYNVFISCEISELEDIIQEAYPILSRNNLNPINANIIKGIEDSPNYVSTLSTTMEDVDLFIGIYGNRFSSKEIEISKNEKIDRLEFEYLQAIKHINKENIFSFCQKQTNELNTKFQTFIEKNKNRHYFNDRADFNKKLTNNLKDWLEKQEKLFKREPDNGMVNVIISAPNKEGILSKVFEGIKTLKGNIVHSNQNIHNEKALIQIITKWESQTNKAPSYSTVKELIVSNLKKMYSSDSMKLVKTDVFAANSSGGEIKSIATYSIEFFDGMGMADRIFSGFIKERISVYQCQFHQVYLSPPIGEFIISVDVTHIGHAIQEKIRDVLLEDPSIFRVDIKVDHGNWWY